MKRIIVLATVMAAAPLALAQLPIDPTSIFKGKVPSVPSTANTRPFYYAQVRVHPKNPDRVWFSSTPILVSNDGGKTARPQPALHKATPVGSTSMPAAADTTRSIPTTPLNGSPPTPM